MRTKFKNPCGTSSVHATGAACKKKQFGGCRVIFHGYFRGCRKQPDKGPDPPAGIRRTGPFRPDRGVDRKRQSPPVSVHIRDLEQAGLVTIVPDPRDNRKRLISLSSDTIGRLTNLDRDAGIASPSVQYTPGGLHSHDEDIAAFFRFCVLTFRTQAMIMGINLDPVLQRTGETVGQALAPQLSAGSIEEVIRMLDAFWNSHGLGRIVLTGTDPVTLEVRGCFECENPACHGPWCLFLRYGSALRGIFPSLRAAGDRRGRPVLFFGKRPLPVRYHTLRGKCPGAGSHWLKPSAGAEPRELGAILSLYSYLNPGDAVPGIDARITKAWERILTDPDHYYFVANEEGVIIGFLRARHYPKPHPECSPVWSYRERRDTPLAPQAGNRHPSSPPLMSNCTGTRLLQGHAAIRQERGTPLL